MHYILYLSLSGLYAAWAGKGDSPVVVHRNRTILDVDSNARRLGAFPGLSLREAKAMQLGVRFVEWKDDDDDALRASWLDPMLEFTDRIESHAPHEAYLDLAGHPDPLSIIPACLERAKFPLVAGLGYAKWVARATTRASQPLSQDHVVRPERSLKELPANCLPIPVDVSERLEFLGYRTIGQVQTATKEILRNQFGEIGHVIHSAAWGGHIEPVMTNYPPDTIAVRVYMEEPWIDREMRDHDLRTLASKMGRALVDQDRCARCLQLTLIDENGDRDVRERVFSRPIRTGSQVFTALMAIANEAFPAVEARGKLTRLERTSARQFELARMRASSATETMRDTVEGVRARFGSTSVVAGAEWSVPRRKAVLRAWCDATGWV